MFVQTNKDQHTLWLLLPLMAHNMFLFKETRPTYFLFDRICQQTISFEIPAVIRDAPVSRCVLTALTHSDLLRDGWWCFPRLSS